MVRASERGMGVAVITRVWGISPRRAPFWRSASRWITPKRCCSSTTIRPSLLELHALLDDGVRAHDHIHFARSDFRVDLLLLFGGRAAFQ